MNEEAINQVQVKLPRYIFPNPIAKTLSKVSLGTQYESSMLGSTLIIFGLITTVIYFFIYFNFPLWYKIVLAINGIAGVMVLLSSITTTYQQYVNYKQAIELQKLITGIDAEKGAINPSKAKKVRYTFALIEIIVSLGLFFWISSSWSYLFGIPIIHAIYIIIKTKKFIKGIDVKEKKNTDDTYKKRKEVILDGTETDR